MLGKIATKAFVLFIVYFWYSSIYNIKLKLFFLLLISNCNQIKMPLINTDYKKNRCLEWFDFSVLIIVKVIFLLWGLAILGIFLKMFEITRGFKILLPFAFVTLIISYFIKNKLNRKKAIAMSLFVFVLFLITKVMDIIQGTKYFAEISL